MRKRWLMVGVTASVLTVPVHASGRLSVNTQISGYYNVVRPDFGPNWQIRAQVQLMFPK